MKLSQLEQANKLKARLDGCEKYLQEVEQLGAGMRLVGEKTGANAIRLSHDIVQRALKEQIKELTSLLEQLGIDTTV